MQNETQQYNIAVGGGGGGVGAACSDEMVSLPGAQVKYARTRQGTEALWR